MSECVTIRVSGRHFEMTRAMMKMHPSSTLGQLHDSEKTEFVFHRPTAVFESVLGYYQTGHLHLPVSVCPAAVQAEFEFWGIGLDNLDRCCRRNLEIFYNNQKIIESFEKSEKEESPTVKSSMSPCLKGRIHVWNILDNPFSSTIAKIYFAASCFMILLSAVLIVVASLPEYKKSLLIEDWEDYFGDYFSDYEEEIHRDFYLDHNDTSPFDLPKAHKPNTSITILEHICSLFFILELLVKLLVCPRFVLFFKSITNIIDLLAVMASIALFTVERVHAAERYLDNNLDALRALLIVRVLRLFRIARNVRGGRILFHALKMSMKEVGLMVLLIAINAFLFGSLVYYFDMENVDTILDGSWWAIVTMTTVGYGDIFPSNTLSRCIGTVCAGMGVVVLSLTIPLFVNNFTTLYMAAAIPRKNKEQSGNKPEVKPVEENAQVSQ